mmetsp:Transcript_44728/g.116337  ORF Transcript_44728/g.116337 Transcript_44728/m.116337 type:complete len:234 (-) Transcript_44728:38-739(-)
MMPPLWPSYAAASGAASPCASARPSWSSPWSSPCCELWTSAVSLLASCELSMEAATMALSACTTFVARRSCSMEAPPLRISRSRMPIARSIAPITSTSSASAAAKSFPSVARMVEAAFRSASAVAMADDAASMSAVSASILALAFWMSAANSLDSPSPVLISYAKFFDRSSHHSANFSNVALESSPSLMTLVSRLLRSCSTLATGESARAGTGERPSAAASSTTARAAITERP